jgi:sodium-dependent dicarboxylate transporter 2/3/5
VLLFICWKYLTTFAFSFKNTQMEGGRSYIKEQLRSLGKMGFEESLVLIVFVVTALLWICRSVVLKLYIPALDDTIIAILAALVLFMLPAKEKGKQLLEWKDAVKLPWGVLMLFGGGIAIAVAFDQSGLAGWIATQLSSLQGVHLFMLLLLLVVSVNFLTEITSNLATASVLLPVLAPLALAMNIHPYVVMVGCTLAASCAFMLPVATPPNAIVFGSGYLTISDMMRAGIWLNVISILLLTLAVYFLLPLLWDIDIHSFPNAFK